MNFPGPTNFKKSGRVWGLVLALRRYLCKTEPYQTKYIIICTNLSPNQVWPGRPCARQEAMVLASFVACTFLNIILLGPFLFAVSDIPLRLRRSDGYHDIQQRSRQTQFTKGIA